MRYQHCALLAGFIAATMLACKKDADNSAPGITILSPVDGLNVNIPDTLTVKFQTHDDQGVQHVFISISDANGITVGNTASVSPGSNPATISVRLPLTSEHIATGQYTLVARAVDGSGSDAKDYRTLNINASPLRLRGVFAVCAPGANSVELYRIDSTGQIALANTFITDLNGAAISSYSQFAYIEGSESGSLFSIAPDGISTGWQKPNLGNLSGQYFTSIDVCDDNRVYVGTSDAFLRGYNAGTGATELNIAMNGGYRADRTVLVHDLVISAQHHNVTQEKQLNIYQQGSGALFASQPLDKSEVHMFGRDDDHVLIFGNRSGQGVVEDRNVQLGGGWEPRTWSSTITAVDRVDANTFLVALADGSLERFTYSNAGSLTIANGTVITDMRYDNVHGLMYAAAGTSVEVIDPQTGTTVTSYPTASSVRYVLPLFNR